jgi:hypothetical protein
VNKKLIALTLFVLLIVFSVATVIAFAKTDLARFEIKNKTVPAGETKVFTVERLIYDQTTWSCDKSASGTIDIKTFMHLTFTKCAGEAPNKGERGLEKVHIDDAPYGVGNRFNFEED